LLLKNYIIDFEPLYRREQLTNSEIRKIMDCHTSYSNFEYTDLYHPEYEDPNNNPESSGLKNTDLQKYWTPTF